MTSDMFYDVSNTIYSHSPSQGAFWYQPSTRPNADDQDLCNHNNGSGGLECPIFISSNAGLNTRNNNTSCSNRSSSINNIGKDYTSNITSPQTSREQTLGARRPSTRQIKSSLSHGENDLATTKDNVQDKGEFLN